ncbi:hypothetical protein OG562_04300 [Streptomyces sp. NBC_01275]|uniref:hypothetical protein n=1 Tax=Streptomyces sp. NBC_01275 TaxID=2903807 RepID=UPI002255C183|nr:hypothetical protein [Streptomyces sp. NBC_01275]MCX4760213.1 hypothetical protein [Streptomyces sp. NBC_01275]
MGVLVEAFRLTLAPDRWAALDQRRGRLLGCGRALDAVDLDGERLRPALRIEWE